MTELLRAVMALEVGGGEDGRCYDLCLLRLTAVSCFFRSRVDYSYMLVLALAGRELH